MVEIDPTQDETTAVARGFAAVIGLKIAAAS